MFFQKVFHVHQSLSETRQQLTRVGAYRTRLPGLKKAFITADGVAQFECAVDPRLDLHAVIVELPTDEENAVLFHSTVGNVRIAGMIALAPVRPGLTEVRLTVDYCIRSLVARVIDFCTRRVERYVEETLRSLQGCLNGDNAACSAVKGLTFTASQLQPAH
jgi:hypothetical protein